MKKYLCILIAAMLLTMVPTTVEAQTKQKSKTRVERKTTKKQSRKKAKKSTSNNKDNKQQLDYERVSDDDVKVKKESDGRDDYEVVGILKEEIVLEEPAQKPVKEEIVVEKPAQKPVWNNEERIYTSVEQMPQYPGGDAALMKYVQSHIKYPPMAKENNIQGKVIVQFVVLKDGSIGEVKIVRSVDKCLDKEAVRVVKSLPKFMPGRQNGQPVAVWYTLPVSFCHLNCSVN